MQHNFGKILLGMRSFPLQLCLSCDQEGFFFIYKEYNYNKSTQTICNPPGNPERQIFFVKCSPPCLVTQDRQVGGNAITAAGLSHSHS